MALVRSLAMRHRRVGAGALLSAWRVERLDMRLVSLAMRHTSGTCTLTLQSRRTPRRIKRAIQWPVAAGTSNGAPRSGSHDPHSHHPGARIDHGVPARAGHEPGGARGEARRLAK